MVKALDALKSVLAERKAKAQKLTAESGQKWVRRSDLEQKRVEEYLENQRLEEEKAKADEEERFRRLNEHLAKSDAMNKQTTKEIPGHLYDEALLGDDDAEPPLSIGEVIERLREMGLPITLFGETDMQRYRRLRNEEKEAHEGKKNPDVMMLESLHQTQQQQMMLNDQVEKDGEDDDDEENAAGAGAGGGNNEDDDEDKEDSDAEDPADADELLNGGGRRAAQPAANSDKSDSDCEDAGMQAAAAADAGDKSDSDAEDPTAAPAAKQPEVAMQDNLGKPGEDLLAQVEVDNTLMDKCDFIRTWARKALKAWEKELADKPEEEKKKAICKQEMAQHRQVRRDVRPLQKRLRMYVMDQYLLGKIHNIVKHADDREYRDANEAYLDLSIGKAAWPVGIGCGGSMLMEDAIGLHDRFNRMANVKDIAYALNDDVTRKYVQALKRLMNVAQRYWPPYDFAQA
uniref:Pre-mRNA-splicing factor 18 n=1 Tax=Alexandrium catenella TaxID=2925 RepID=A0A7S1LQ33_ALECA